MQIDELTVIAWHETGHAVVARAMGVPVECVSIKGRRPVTRYGRARSPEEGVWITLAARVVVLELTGSPELADYGADGDSEALESFLRGFSTHSERERVMEEVQTGLPDLVRSNEPAIKKVAQELLKREKLSRRELDHLLKDLLVRKVSEPFHLRLLSWVRRLVGRDLGCD